MCEIFPEVNKCCCVIPIRIGLLFIGILAIMTGVVAQSASLKKSGSSYDKTVKGVKNMTQIDFSTFIKNPKTFLTQLSTVVTVGISATSLLFIVLGIVILVANLTDSAGTVFIFMWGIMLNVLLGLLALVAVAAQCALTDSCLLSGMEWLSGACVLVLSAAYLLLWVYFAAVANAYFAEA